MKDKSKGKEQMMEGIILPKSDVCQECAVKHRADEPHNLQSLYYQMQFRLKYNRQPTWEDAMAHCEERIKKMWREELTKLGEAIK